MGILSVNRSNIYLDNNVGEDDPDIIILIRFDIVNFKSAKHSKKDK